MATISFVSHSRLGRYKTLAAEYYQPHFMCAEQMVEKLGKHCFPLKACTKSAYPITYGVLKPRQVDTSTFRLARIQNAEAVFVFGDDLPPISAVQFEEYRRSEVRLGDIIIAIGGNIGPLGIISDSASCRLNINRHLARISPEERVVDGYYLVAYLASPVSRALLDREVRGAVQAGINIADLKLHPVFLPDPETQRVIGDLVRAGERALKNSRLAHSSAKQLLEEEIGVNRLMFRRSRGYTVLSSDLASSRRSDAEYYNPATREVIRRITAKQHTRVRDSFDVTSGFPWNSAKFLPDNSGEPVVRIRNIKPDHIIPDELTSIDPSYANSIGAAKAQKGDVVVGMDGIKYFYASLLEGTAYVNQRVCHLSRRASGTISPEYAAFMINSSIGQAQLMRDMTVATTVGHITNRDVSRLVIPTVSRAFHDKVTGLIRESIDGKEEAKRLLTQANVRIEQIIKEAEQP
ncbi:hypothetical protein FTW19_09495 [Terriglobus albidus]|uniref:Type I restriction modification DNA specificity domain-containing protein n=1 Tax=Terriglobus albidus TaxID=1592106 RepID=A0A5B9E8T6_9BACT|nr:hypothetical protein [Terriglobus albidus]QEE28209.1 hypothetical protein FTW19_09495 [Terriglobus albidus]